MKLYSFDIFDTCLVRACGLPENVFYILGEEILGQEIDEALLRDFVRERGRAECVAKQKLEKEAVTIEEIYNFFDTSLYTNQDQIYILKKEIDIERRLLIPVKDMIEKVNACRKKGKIAFISDMYLPNEMLKELLIKAGLLQEGDSLYVSGSIGYTKQSGRLYKYVGEKENVRFSEWAHCGDNFFSDYVRPRKLGIKAKKVAYSYSNIEKRWIDESIYMKDKWVGKAFAGLSRSLRLQNGIIKDDFVFNVMMPAFVPFTYYLLQKAKEDSIDKLYFASRDTYILFLIAKQISHFFPEIELRYIYISTKVLYPAGIQSGNRDEIYRILDLLGRFKPIQILKLFGFTDEEIFRIGNEMDINSECYAKDAMEFLDLLTNEDINSKLIAHSNNKREKLLAYLIQEKFIGDGNVALFDIGWRGTSQAILNRILPNTPTYYYWGVYKTRNTIKDMGSFFSFSYMEDYHRLGAAKFIEFYMCKTLGGSTMDYVLDGGEYKPVLAEVNSMVEEDEDFNKNRTFMLQAIDIYEVFPSLYNRSNDIFNILSLKTLHQIAKNPPYSFVKELERKLYWDHYVDKQKMITFLHPFKIFDIGKNIYRKTAKYNGLWIEGSVIYTFGKFGNWILKNDIAKFTKRIGKRIIGILES